MKIKTLKINYPYKANEMSAFTDTKIHGNTGMSPVVYLNVIFSIQNEVTCMASSALSSFLLYSSTVMLISISFIIIFKFSRLYNTSMYLTAKL